MTPEEFHEVDRIFQRLRRLPKPRRPEALAREELQSSAIRAEVDALLAAYEDSDDDAFLDTPALGSAFPVLPIGTGHIPAEIGRYRIIEPLGEGGMARVFVAEQERPRRRVALKIMRTMLGPRAEKRFELEAMVLGRLRHPGIAQIYEAGIHQADSDRLPYIAMELVEGEQLKKVVARRRLDQSTTLKLFTHICDAVQHAHQQGVIHRDLKPSNILVEERDNRLFPKILDLGIARATDIDVQATTMRTSVGELVGTLQYMSPEQAAGDPSDIDTRSDVYSLGVILYELLTASAPLDLHGKPIHEALRTIREDDPPTLRSIDTTLNSDLEIIAHKAMEKDKRRRYQSARDLANDIRHYLANEPIAARHPSAAYQLRKFARRNRALVAGAICFGVAMAIGLIGMTWFAIGKSHALQAETHALARAVTAQKAAETSQAQAERRFDEVRKLAGVFIGELDARIRDLPGSTDARQFIVATGLDYLDNLEKEAGDDFELRNQVAAGYFKLGDIQGYPDEPNLGDRIGAWTSYQKGLALIEKSRTESPDDPGLKRTQSIAFSRSAVMLELLNRKAEAEEFENKAYDILLDLRDEMSDNPGYLGDLAYHENRLGDDALAHRDFESAATRFQAARALYESIARLDADNTIGRRGVAASYDRLARLALAHGDFRSTLRWNEQYIEATLAMLEDGNEREAILIDLAVGYDQLGLAHRATGDHEKALDAFMRSLEIREAQIKADPKNMQARSGVRSSYCHVGEEALALGRSTQARERYEQYADACRYVAAAEPDNARALRELAVSYYKMAEWNLREAADPSLAANDIRAHRRDALVWLKKCHGAFVGIRDRGLLWESDAGVIDQLRAEIASCSATITNTDAIEANAGD